MRNRTPLYFLAGFLLAAVLVCASTNVAAGNKHTSNAWLIAQEKTPLLWMVDGCALIILMGSWLLGVAINSLQNESVSQSDENSRHIAVLTETVQDLFRQNNEYISRLEALEESGDAWHEGFEEEARRLTEQAFLALSDNIETNALKLEAINLALRYQRAEMQAVRGAFKTGEIAPPAGSPPSLEIADVRPKPILPEWRKPQDEADANVIQDSNTLEPQLESAEVDSDEISDFTSSIPDDEDSPGPKDIGEPEYAGGMVETDLDEESEKVDEEPNGVTVTSQPSPIADKTVNAGAAVAETLEFDASEGAVVIGDHAGVDSNARAGLAADEFRRIKQDQQSIFRQKRR